MQTRSRTVEMPSGLSLPLAFGMNTRLIGSGRYVTGITRLQRYCEPLRHPSAPGLFLAGVRLIIPITHWGFPCCVRFPCVHAAATTPVQRLGVVFARVTQPCQPSPEGVAGSACTSTFSRHARRSLALRPAHSRGHQFVTRYPKASDISSPPCLLRLLPAGANRRVGLHPLESAALSRRTPIAVNCPTPSAVSV